jgi:hypothetical protein
VLRRIPTVAVPDWDYCSSLSLLGARANSSMISRGRVRARWARISGRVTACRFHDLLVGDSYMAGGTIGLRDAGHESFLSMRRALSAIGKNAMTSVCVEARAL